jgi:hypothetical protein
MLTDDEAEVLFSTRNDQQYFTKHNRKIWHIFLI